MHRFIGVLVVCLLFVATTKADVLFGECKPKDGAKISTSWNSRVTYSKNGKYRLDFGGKVNATVTVYVNGKRYARIKVDGATQLDIDASR